MYPSVNAAAGFTIGALARQSCVPIDTIRHYEREGLLPAPARRASGYREYDAPAVERIRFIRSAKDLGFTLGEIRDLLVFSADHEHGIEGIKQRATERLADINLRIDTLMQTRDRLNQLVEACPGTGALSCCPILSSIQGDAPAAATSPSAAAARCCSPLPAPSPAPSAHP